MEVWNRRRGRVSLACGALAGRLRRQNENTKCHFWRLNYLLDVLGLPEYTLSGQAWCRSRPRRSIRSRYSHHHTKFDDTKHKNPLAGQKMCKVVLHPLAKRPRRAAVTLRRERKTISENVHRTNPNLQIQEKTSMRLSLESRTAMR